MKKHNLLIGTSGYSYNHWERVFYPEDLPKNRWLEFYGEHFNTVELNVTFYRLPNKNTFLDWRRKTPNNFKFSVKASRYITQYKKLSNAEIPLNNFVDQIIGLKEKISVVLWQLPPNFPYDEERLVNFCKVLSRVSGTRNCFEFRHGSWFRESTYKILEQYGFPIVFADYPFDIIPDSNGWTPDKELASIAVPLISDFVYIRRHGFSPYSSKYTNKELKKYSSSIKKILENRDIYVYFNNDAEGNAVLNAAELIQMTDRR